MARKTERVDIGGVTYEVTQLPALKASEGLAKLMKIAGGIAAATAGSEIAAIFSSIGEKDIEWFARYFAPTTKVILMPSPGAEAPMALNLEMHFTDSLRELIEWLAFCLKLNYADFLGDLGSLGATLTATPSLPKTS